MKNYIFIGMEEIEISEYYKMTEDERLQYDRFIFTLCDKHLQELTTELTLSDAKYVFTDSLKVQMSEYEEEENYEVCGIITKAINYIKNYK